MSLETYNGNSLVAMTGKQCVAIGADTRFGIQFTTISTNSQKVYRIQDNILLGLNGLATDMQTFALEMKRKVELYRLRENIDLTPELFMNLVASTLYEHRFAPYYIEPIVVGLDVTNNYEPFVACSDSIGCISNNKAFAVGGTSSDLLYGCCESYWKKDLNPEDLFEVVGQSLIGGIERDILSGWGGMVYTMTPGNISVKKIKVRQD